MCLLWLRQLPLCGDQTPASIPPPTKGQSSPTNTPVLPPNSFILLSFISSIVCILFYVYSFLGVRCSCLLSAGVLHVLLCLKVYSWCIRGERSTSTYSSIILFSHSVLRASHWLYSFRNSVLSVDSELSISIKEEIYQWNEFVTAWCQSGNLSTYTMLQISDTRIEMVNL